MVAALDGQDGCPRPLEGFQDLGMLVSYSPLAPISSKLESKLKINHWRSSPGPPELAGFYVDSVWARTYGIWARTVFIYVYEAPGIQPSRLWQPGSMGLVSLSRALVPR